MYDLSAIMRTAHTERRKAIQIAAGKKVKDLVTGKFKHPEVPPLGEFLREAWRRVRSDKNPKKKTLERPR